MRKLNLLALITILFSTSGFAQQCDCEKNFQWVKKTFEENDAGFQYVIDQKGQDAYEAHNNAIMARTQSVETLQECAPILYDWLRFFRKGHFGISVKQNQQQAIVADPSLVAEQARLTVDEKEFEKRINSLTEPSLEGVWVSAPYTVGIVKTNGHYTGFIIDAPGTEWEKHQVKLKLFTDSSSSKGEYWMRDFSKRENQDVKVIGHNLIKIGGSFSLTRVKPVYEDSQTIKDYLEFLNTGQPYFKKIADETAYLRIPSFGLSEKKAIDSVVKANHHTITGTPNLIIDLRFNGGGADGSFRELLPYLYTNPIRTVGVQLLSTELNNEAMLNYSQDEHFDEQERKWFKEAYEKLNQNLGKFVQMNDEAVSVRKLDTIYPQPAAVAIIIDENNASTTEQFLLAAKQSKKTKLFGTTTFGALDISNMNGALSPCGEFELWYCRSKSFRIPDMAIDGKGIQPDYYIDNSIPKHNWVDFVEEALK